MSRWRPRQQRNAPAAPWLDGTGSMVMTYVEGIDLHQTWGTTDEAENQVDIARIRAKASTAKARQRRGSASPSV